MKACRVELLAVQTGLVLQGSVTSELSLAF